MNNKKLKPKIKQEYEAKPVFPKCANCKHYKSEEKIEEGYYANWTKEVNMRCGLGGFAVKKYGTCKMHEKK